MKKTIYSLIVGAIMLTACADFTELQPKGKNMLNSTDDLELLLNPRMDLVLVDLGSIGGDYIYSFGNVLAGFEVVNKTATTLRMGFFDDEASISRLEDLTTADDYYTSFYSWIGTIANPILQQLPTAKGDETKKRQLKSEALALRAYSHFMILQKFAKAYNPSTAADDPAVIYLTEDVDITVNQQKKSVQECYELALADINAAIAEGGLPTQAINLCRLNKAAGYAIKAHICMAMQKYTEAEEAAKQALAENSTLYDYWNNKQMDMSFYGDVYEFSGITCFENPEVYYAIPDLLFYMWMVPESWNNIEDGYYTKDLITKLSDIYSGEPGESRDVTVGLPGWEAICNLFGDNYDNMSGLATPMMYLYIAECELRSGNIDMAMDYLDQLRKARMSAEKFVPLKGTISSKADAIAKMKQVSFEENAWTGWNFMQRKRWNVEAEWETTLSRTLGGVTYTLSPKSNLWVFPFPKPARDANPNLVSNKNN